MDSIAAIESRVRYISLTAQKLIALALHSSFLYTQGFLGNTVPQMSLMF